MFQKGRSPPLPLSYQQISSCYEEVCFHSMEINPPGTVCVRVRLCGCHCCLVPVQINMTRHLDGKRDHGHGSVNQMMYTETERERKNRRGKSTMWSKQKERKLQRGKKKKERLKGIKRTWCLKWASSREGRKKMCEDKKSAVQRDTL